MGRVSIARYSFSYGRKSVKKLQVMRKGRSEERFLIKEVQEMAGLQSTSRNFSEV